MKDGSIVISNPEPVKGPKGLYFVYFLFLREFLAKLQLYAIKRGRVYLFGVDCERF